MPPFDLTATYDAASLRAAASVLFRRFWVSQLPFTAAAFVSVLVAATLLWYFRVAGLNWLLPAYLALFVALWVFTRWNIQRRLMKRLGKSVNVRLTSTDFSVASDGELHTFPWTRFKSILTDDHNLYLFITKRAAFVVPTTGLPLEAQQFAIARVREHGAAV